MTIHPFVLKALEDQEEIVMALDDPKVTEAAKKIAFYVAMIDAAEEDPMDPPETQAEILLHFKTIMNNEIVIYQKFVNGAL